MQALDVHRQERLETEAPFQPIDATVVETLLKAKPVIDAAIRPVPGTFHTAAMAEQSSAMAASPATEVNKMPDLFSKSTLQGCADAGEVPGGQRRPRRTRNPHHADLPFSEGYDNEQEPETSEAVGQCHRRPSGRRIVTIAR